MSGATFQAGKRVGLRGKASATPGPALGRGGVCLETAGVGKSVGILQRLDFLEFWQLGTPELAASPWGASTWRPRPSILAPGEGHLTPGKLPLSAPFHLLIRTAGKSLGDGNGPCSPAPISFLLQASFSPAGLHGREGAEGWHGTPRWGRRSSGPPTFSLAEPGAWLSPLLSPAYAHSDPALHPPCPGLGIEVSLAPPVGFREVR